MRRSSVMAILYISLMSLAVFAGRSPTQTLPVEGLRNNTPAVHALTDARIVQAPGRIIERGTVILRDGTIEAAGTDVKIPPDARVWDYDGLTVYAGLVDLYSHVGLKKPGKTGGGGSNAASDDDVKGAGYWTDKVTPQRNILESFEPKKKDLEKMRALGFTTALLVPDRGVIGGASALISLGDAELNEREIRARATQCMSLVRPRGFSREYPTSLMGQIALIRQALLDAQWYGEARQAYASNPSQPRPESNEALETLHGDMRTGLPMLCAVGGDLDIARAEKLAREFGLDLWVRGTGHEYRAADALKRSGSKLIVPVDYPKTPDVTTPEKALEVTLADLQHWDAAPSNAAMLEDAGVEFALTPYGLEKPETFHGQVRKAIERGLSEETALAALTTVPARMLGLGKTLGTVERGRAAHLVVTDGDLFAKETKVVGVWIDGRLYDVDKRPEVDPRGTWEVTLDTPEFDDEALHLEITGETDKLKGTIRRDSTEIKLDKVSLDLRRLALRFSARDLDVDGVVRMSGAVEKTSLSGQGELPDGRWFRWTAVPAPDEDDDGGETKDKSKEKKKEAPDTFTPPSGYGAYGKASLPAQPKHVLVKNATLWTSGPAGNLERTDMLVTRGRITKIGRGLEAPAGATVIDAAGKHVTPGLIDCHSHSAASGGVNEFGQAVSAEVRVSDILNPRDVGLYRALAGGLTVANVLHGSANPIGGQSAVIKLRWGASPDALLVEDAKPAIKFALGENVKRSNWSNPSNRYPQTRMGVEQLIRDRFKAARDYEKQWAEYNSNKKRKGVVPPRRDLELETLLEILNGERLVHCHSYRQDEILMLVRVAEDFGFQIGAFQHVLEGYKVAEALAAHGAGASTFSDWWAYKFEVYDAIPYNGALMHDVGVVVSFNSDSSELARRMNLEAAKAVKYGGVPKQEALKFVTLNPAIQLRIDHRVGSLEAGKDADFVVWSGDPLSTYTVCEQTWIEGRKYFDIDDDLAMRDHIAAERSRLIQKALTSDGDGGSGKRGKSKYGSATGEQAD